MSQYQTVLNRVFHHERRQCPTAVKIDSVALLGKSRVRLEDPRSGVPHLG
jgi:hypothetical protein